MKIVYESCTGHTKQYAQMLSGKLNIPCYTIREAKANLKEHEDIIFIGWVCAAKIQGLKKAEKKYNVICFSAVGLYPCDDEYVKSLKEANRIDKAFFYMRGGLDYSKLKGFKRKVLQLVSKSMAKDSKPENRELSEIFKNGGTFVSESNLEPMLNYINERNLCIQS